MTTRRLMIAVALVAVLLGFILTVDSPGTIALGVGHRDTQLVFIVSDADFGHPIEGVSVRLRDPDLPEAREPPFTIDLKTGPDGRASIRLNLQFVTSTDTTGGKLFGYRVVYRPWEMRFAKEGYQVLAVPFKHSSTESGRYRRSHIDDEPQPPIVIRLRRLPRRQAKP
jgi:hypothetical protein